MANRKIKHITATLTGSSSAETFDIYDDSAEHYKKRCIFIGDSYAAGYTPETGDMPTDGWPARVKERLELSDDDCYVLFRSGAGFSPSTTGGGFNGILTDEFIASVSEPEKITDIVIGGGRNDAGQTLENIKSGFNSCVQRLHSAFPNAKIRIAFFGWDGNSTVQDQLLAACTCWHNAVYNSTGPIVFMGDTPFCLLNKSYLSPGDQKHPNAGGNGWIADAIICNLFGSKFHLTSNLIFNGALTPVSPFTFSNGGTSNGGWVTGNTAVYASLTKELTCPYNNRVTVSGNHGALPIFNLPQFPINSTTSSVSGETLVRVLLHHQEVSGRLYTMTTMSMGIHNGVITLYLDNLNANGTNFQSLAIYGVTIYPFILERTINL